MRRDNWWWFGFWYIGPMRYPTHRITYDLRVWMFGWSYHFGAWKVSIGPFEVCKMTAISVPAKADLKAVQ